ncbi:MAG TPA: hypothetical protein VGK94_12880 [Candidatus Polarisedimenticolia bacterium]
MRHPIVVAAALAILMPLPAAAAAGKPERPEMKLRVSTHHGYLPLSLSLEGMVTGTEPAGIQECLLTVEWSYTTPGGQRLNSKTESPCVDTPAEARVPESFKKSVTLKEAGTYSYRIVLVGKEGKRFASTSQEVQVIKSPLEVGAAATRTDGRP